MAMIKCPECGRQVSSAAKSCPSCGYPLAEESDSGYVKIKTPAQIEGTKPHLFRKQMASIFAKGIVNWHGELGSIARFKINGPTKVLIDLGNKAEMLETTVYPNTSYKLEYVRTRFLSLPEYELVEI